MYHVQTTYQISLKAVASSVFQRLTSGHDKVTAAMLLLYLSSTAIFMPTALLNLLIACLPLSRGLAAQDFLLLLILILSIYLMQELTSIFTLSSLTLVNLELSSFVCFSTCL